MEREREREIERERDGICASKMMMSTYINIYVVKVPVLMYFH